MRVEALALAAVGLACAPVRPTPAPVTPSPPPAAVPVAHASAPAAGELDDVPDACRESELDPATLVGADDPVFAASCLRLDGSVDDPTLLSRFDRLRMLVLESSTSDVTEVLRALASPRLEVLELRYAGITDLTVLRQLTGLRVLRMTWVSDAPIDLAFVAAMPELRVLEIDDSATNVAAVASASKLQRLELHSVSRDEDLTPLANLRQLVHLVLGGQTTDLSPLASLPRIRSIVANSSQLARIPVRAMPSLRYLSVLDTRVRADQVAAFRRANPQTTVADTYEGVLRSALGSADRTRLTIGGCRKINQQPAWLQAVEARRLLQAIAVVPPGPEGSSRIGCSGDTHIDFYRQHTLLGRLSLFSEIGVARFEGWPSDVHLTPESRAAVDAWLRRQ